VDGPQPVEGVVLEQLFLNTNRGWSALSVAYEQDQLAVGHTTQDAFHECRADEPGCPRDGDALASERFCDHNTTLSTTW